MPRIVVCGAGSAGCVVAARLSEDAANEVILLEAGPDYPTLDAMPDLIRIASVGEALGTHHDWGYFDAELTTAPNPTYAGISGSQLPIFRGKVVGGSSSVNAANFLRPHEYDFDSWVSLGAIEWGWPQVLDTLRELERDESHGDWHGRDGKVPVKRIPRNELRPILRDFLYACAEQGHPVVEDLNAPGAVGAGTIPFNAIDGVRQSAAITYLAEARERSNLHIRSGVEIDRVNFDSRTATGVRLASGEEISADLVVLSAGVIGSPAILMRSGIGPEAHLTEQGIEVVEGNEGVGANLQDHPTTKLTFRMTPAPGDDSPATLQTMLTCSSSGSHLQAEVDLNILPFVFQRDQLFISVGLMKSRSVGYLRLTDRVASTPPDIHLRYFSRPDDLPRLVRGVQFARAILGSRCLAQYNIEEVFPGSAVRSTSEIADVIRAAPYSFAHSSGTCRMGYAGVQGAVVDQFGEVHGVSRLAVIDASIMPVIPSTPTNSTTMMLAERCAGALRKTIASI